MVELCKMNPKRGWVQQFHPGTMRNINTRMFRKKEADTGFSSIGNPRGTYRISKFPDLLHQEDKLIRTILYNVNPAATAMLIIMPGNFHDGRTPGKMQRETGW